MYCSHQYLSPPIATPFLSPQTSKNLKYTQTSKKRKYERGYFANHEDRELGSQI